MDTIDTLVASENLELDLDNIALSGRDTISINSYFSFPEQKTHILHVGSTCFLTARFAPYSPPCAILLDEDNSLDNTTITPYSALCIEAMHGIDFTGQTCLDFGSGDGLLSLLASKRGAQHVIAVDNDENNGERIARHCTLNSIDNITFIHADLRLLNAYFLPRKSSIVLANIGPHYGMSDLRALDMLDSLPNVHTFLGGGYTQGRRSNHSSSPAIARLREKGFSQYSSVCEYRRHGRCAFVCRRNLDDPL